MRIIVYLFLLVLPAGLLAQTEQDSVTNAAGRKLPVDQRLPLMTAGVNDLETDFSSTERVELENLLAQLKAQDSSEIVILTGKDFIGDLSDYCSDVLTYWEIGGRNARNGALIFVSKEKKRAWISMGKQFGKRVTHERANGIIRNTMVPLFKQSKFFEGTRDALKELIKLLQAG
jgi:uncharacterized protein